MQLRPIHLVAGAIVVLLVGTGLGVGAVEVLDGPDATKSLATPQAEPVSMRTPEWAFTARAAPPAEEGGDGAVQVALLSLESPPDNETPVTSIPIEVAAVAWNRSWPDDAVFDSMGRDILPVINRMLRESPSVAFTKTRLARHGDDVQLDIPGELSPTTIIVFASETRAFLFYDWPSGTPYRWNTETLEFEVLDAGTTPLLFARGPGGS